MRRARAITLAVVLSALLAAPLAAAAFEAVLGNAGNAASAASVALTDDDGGSAALVMANAAPGASDAGCTRVTYAGSVPSRVRHFATRTGELVDRGGLRLRVTRGTSSAPSFRSCGTFTADATDYNGLGAGVLYDGPLNGWGTSWDAATLDPSGVTAGRYAATVGGESGLRNHYRLGETSGTTAVDSAGGAGGTYEGTLSRGATPPPANVGNGALGFTSSYGRLLVPRTIADDFSIELWLKTTQTANPNRTFPQWYHFNALADGEINGQVADFGLTMTGEGRLAAGTGGPFDTTAYSRKGFNDGRWHHVVMTRVRATGAIAIYVDGGLQGGATGSTVSLTAPSNLSVGRNLLGGNPFVGTLDEVALYDRALSAAEVRAHYRAPLDLEAWTSGEHHDYKHEIELVQDSDPIDGRSETVTLNWEARP